MTTPLAFSVSDYAPAVGAPTARSHLAIEDIEPGDLLKMNPAVTGATPSPAGVGPTAAAADSYAFVGVAAHAAAAGMMVTVLSGPVVHESDASAAVTAGQFIAAAANGEVAGTAAGAATSLGIALSDAAAPVAGPPRTTSKVRWLAYR